MPISSNEVAEIVARQQAQFAAAENNLRRQRGELPSPYTPPELSITGQAQNSYGATAASVAGSLGQGIANVPGAFFGTTMALGMIGAAPPLLDPWTSAFSVGGFVKARGGGFAAAIPAGLGYLGAAYGVGAIASHAFIDPFRVGVGAMSDGMQAAATIMPQATISQQAGMAGAFFGGMQRGMGSHLEMAQLAVQGIDAGMLNTRSMTSFHQDYARLANSASGVAGMIGGTINEGFAAMRSLQGIGIRDDSLTGTAALIGGYERATGMERSVLLQAGQMGAATAKAYGMDRQEGALAGIKRAARFGYIGRNNLMPDMDENDVNAIEGASGRFFGGSREGQRVLAAMMDDDGNFDEDVARRIAGGGMSRSDITARSRKVFNSRRRMENFNLNAGELMAEFSNAHGAEGISSAVNTMTAGRINERSLRQRLTGLTSSQQDQMAAIDRMSSNIDGEIARSLTEGLEAGKSYTLIDSFKQAIDKLTKGVRDGAERSGAAVQASIARTIDSVAGSITGAPKYQADPYMNDAYERSIGQGQTGRRSRIGAMYDTSLLSVDNNWTPGANGLGAYTPRFMRANAEGVDPMDMPAFGTTFTGSNSALTGAGAGLIGASRAGSSALFSVGGSMLERSGFSHGLNAARAATGFRATASALGGIGAKRVVGGLAARGAALALGPLGTVVGAGMLAYSAYDAGMDLYRMQGIAGGETLADNVALSAEASTLSLLAETGVLPSRERSALDLSKPVYNEQLVAPFAPMVHTRRPRGDQMFGLTEEEEAIEKARDMFGDGIEIQGSALPRLTKSGAAKTHNWATSKDIRELALGGSIQRAKALGSAAFSSMSAERQDYLNSAMANRIRTAGNEGAQKGAALDVLREMKFGAGMSAQDAEAARAGWVLSATDGKAPKLSAKESRAAFDSAVTGGDFDPATDYYGLISRGLATGEDAGGLSTTSSVTRRLAYFAANGIPKDTALALASDDVFGRGVQAVRADYTMARMEATDRFKGTLQTTQKSAENNIRRAAGRAGLNASKFLQYVGDVDDDYAEANDKISALTNDLLNSDTSGQAIVSFGQDLEGSSNPKERMIGDRLAIGGRIKQVADNKRNSRSRVASTALGSELTKDMADYVNDRSGKVPYYSTKGREAIERSIERVLQINEISPGSEQMKQLQVPGGAIDRWTEQFIDAAKNKNVGGMTNVMAQVQSQRPVGGGISPAAKDSSPAEMREAMNTFTAELTKLNGRIKGTAPQGMMYTDGKG